MPRLSSFECYLLDARQPPEASASTRETQKRIPMERENFHGAARPDGVHVPLVKPQNCPCLLGDFHLCFIHRASSTTVDGGIQYTSETEFPTDQWSNGCPTDYIYSVCPSEGHIQEYGSTASNLESVVLVPPPPRSCSFDMNTNPVPDQGRAHLMSGYELQLSGLPLGHQYSPRVLLDQTDIQPYILEGNCQLTDPRLVRSEVVFQLTTDAGNPVTESSDLLQGPTVETQFPHIGSGLKPHARPFGLGNEYVPHELAYASRTDSNLLSDFDVKGYKENLAHRAKVNPLTEDIGTFLRSNPPHLGRRRSMPHRGSRKISSVDQGVSHTHSLQGGANVPRIQVFDANMKIKFRKKRRFSEGEKERIARRRKLGACGECRLKKRRVRHIHRNSALNCELTRGHSAIMI